MPHTDSIVIFILRIESGRIKYWLRPFTKKISYDHHEAPKKHYPKDFCFVVIVASSYSDDALDDDLDPVLKFLNIPSTERERERYWLWTDMDTDISLITS